MSKNTEYNTDIYTPSLLDWGVLPKLLLKKQQKNNKVQK